MTALIDSDIIAYRCAAASENDPEEVAILRVDTMMREILDKEDNYISFLSGPRKTNFRYKINPEYKANRKDKVDPKHRAACKEFLVKEYNSIITEWGEADDHLGCNQTSETVIYSIDKDLMMIPGCHYNFVTKEYREISELDGLKNFYKQMLIGDSSDNIKGIDGIGKVKAARLIDHLESEEEMSNLVFDYYVNVKRDLAEDSIKSFWTNADCLWIMRKEGETFSKRCESLKDVPVKNQ